MAAISPSIWRCAVGGIEAGAGIIFGRDGGLIHLLSDWFQRGGRSVAPRDLRKYFAGRSTREGLAQALAEAAQAAGEGRILILAIDQAEERFDTTDKSKAAEARESLDALLALLATPPAGVEPLVIFAIRADSYDPLAVALARAFGSAKL